MVGAINIDFEIFFYMVVALFGLVGFQRGWWKEAITTGLLVFLLFLLQRPTLAATIIDLINGLIERLITSDVFSATGAIDPPSTIDPGQSQFYIILLVVLILGSYFYGRKTLAGSPNPTSGSQLIGGILGLANGFITLSLVKEYILRRFLPDSGVSAAAAVPTELTFTVSNVPKTGITEGMTVWIIIFVGALLFLYALSTHYKVEKAKVKVLAPPGYPEPKKGGGGGRKVTVEVPD